MCVRRVNYFKIRLGGKASKDSMMWLGVDAFGLNIYHSQDKLAPDSVLPWCDIKNVYYHDKKFTVDTVKNTEPFLVDFVFFASLPAINKIILALCVGNHELYIKRRRQGGFLELNQIKAELETERKEAAQKGLLFRDHAHAMLSDQLKQFKIKAEDAEVALLENAETTQLLVETVEIAETEAALLWQKAEQTETQLNEMMRQNEHVSGGAHLVFCTLVSSHLRPPSPRHLSYRRSERSKICNTSYCKLKVTLGSWVRMPCCAPHLFVQNFFLFILRPPFSPLFGCMPTRGLSLLVSPPPTVFTAMILSY